MDKEYLKRHNLMEAHKQFMRLSEGYLSTTLNEAGEDEQQPQDGQDQGMPPADPNAGAGMPAPDPNAGAPMGGDAPMPPMGPDSGAPQGGDGMPPMGPDAGADMPAPDPNAGAPMGGDAPMPPVNPDGSTEASPNDEVLDVDDLTNAQEELNKKQNSVGHDLGKLDSRIESLLGAVEKMKGIIDHNNNEIADLRKELETRVPTQTEKLNLRSLDTKPYNVNPQSYWDKVNSDGRYSVTYDNDQKEEPKEHVLTQGEIDDYNPSEIERSFQSDDLDQPLDKIFRGF